MIGKDITKLTLNKNKVDMAIFISEKVDFKAQNNKGITQVIS